MQKITINLLGNSKLLQKQKRIKFFFSSSYILLWLFSAVTVYHIYQTNLFISSIYLKEILKIRTEVTRLTPKFERIKLLYQQNKQLATQQDEYAQTLNRADLWLSKMMILSESIPENIRLDKMQVSTKPIKNKNNQFLELHGTARITANNPDNDQLNKFKQSLESNPEFMTHLKKISILETKIETSNNKPVMSFSMAVY